MQEGVTSICGTVASGKCPWMCAECFQHCGQALDAHPGNCQSRHLRVALEIAAGLLSECDQGI